MTQSTTLSDVTDVGKMAGDGSGTTFPRSSSYTDIYEAERLTDRLNNRVRKLDRIYTGLLVQVASLESRYDRYSNSVKLRGDVITVFADIGEKGGTHCLHVLVRSIQQFVAVINRFLATLKLQKFAGTGALNTPDKNASDIALESPGKTLRWILSEIEELISNGDLHLAENIKAATDALIERFDFSKVGLLYLKLMLELCDRNFPVKKVIRGKLSALEKSPTFACDISDCLTFLGRSDGPKDLLDVIKTALRHMINVKTEVPDTA